MFDSLGSLNGEPFISVNVLNEKPYSLFADDRFDEFKNGMFFIQNYFYIEYYPENMTKAVLNDKSKFKPYLHGVLNLEHLDIINEKLNNGAIQQYDLKDLFKSVKYGSRLCWGVAKRGVGLGNAYLEDLNNLDPSEGEYADTYELISTEIFRNYQDKKYTDTLSDPNNVYNNLPDGMHNNQSVFVDQKAMVCVDGILCEFLRKEEGKSFYNSLFEDHKFLYENGQFGDVYNMKDYSIVIPIVKIEQEEDMSITWEEFMQDKQMGSDLNDKVVFQNLMSSLINSDEYNALLKNCFLPQVMIHFNAISGVTSSKLHYYDRFEQTKNILLTSMQNVAAAKDYT